MIIDKVKPYWTEEDRERIRKLRNEQSELADKALEKRYSPREEFMPILERFREIDHEATQIKRTVEERYRKSKTKKEILADVQEILNAITKEDYQDNIAEQLRSLAELQAGGASNSLLDSLKNISTENYEHCYWFVSAKLVAQLNAFASDEDSTEKVQALVHKCVSQWYENPSPSYFPVVQGKPFDAFSYMSGSNATIDKVARTASISKLGADLVVSNFDETRLSLGISADKLLTMALAIFTKQNDFRSGKELNRHVAMDLKEYAKLIGYDVDEHQTRTPEEAKKEKKRAKNQLDNARRVINADLDTLYKADFSWAEYVRGELINFDRIRLVTRAKSLGGEILISFTPEIATYLADRYTLMQYPAKLLRISGRKPTAYYLGKKMSEHFFMDNNMIRGTNDILKISSLLAVTDLPSYEEVQKKDRGHWEQRIKEPFERALDELTSEGILKNWEYTHAKKLPLTEEEASSIVNHRDFVKLYLHFTLADTATVLLENTDRMDKKKQDIEKAKEKKKSKSK